MLGNRFLLLAGAAGAVALLAAADPALAATSIGDNVGKEIETWAKALLLAVAALVGIPALAKRDVSQASLIAVVVVIIGGFIYAGDVVQTVIRTLWKAFQG